MSSRQLAVLACKLLGFYTLYMALRVSFVAVLGMTIGEDSSLVAKGAPALMLLVLGLVLLVQAERIGKLLVGRTEESNPTRLSVPRGFDVVAIALLGMFDLLSSVPFLLSQVLIEMQDSGGIIFIPFAPLVAGTALRIALGLWLVLGARGWSNVLRKLRNAGPQPNERPWPDEAGPADPAPDNSNEG